MDFESAQRYLDSLLSYEALSGFSYDSSNFNLEEFKKFVKKFGIDYSRVKFVNVAGSKGKGSVSNLLAAYLLESGKTVGLFTSPHLFDVRERIIVNGAMIDCERFSKYISTIRDFIENNPELKRLTYFEVLTVLALKYFADEGVEYVILEVGLGGRLDCTNIVDSSLCVLTRVEMEHVGILGNTIEEILNEKLGIFHGGAPLVVGEQNDEVSKLIRAEFEGGRFKGEKCCFFKTDNFSELSNVKGLFDKAKLENAGTAFAALEILSGKVDKKLFIEVLKNFRLPGRFDVRKIGKKIVVFDVAHTVSSIKNLCEALLTRFAEKGFVFIVSLMKGKNIEEIFEVIGDVASKIVFTSSNVQRGYSGNELKELFVKGVEADVISLEVVEEAEVAFESTLKNLSNDSVLVVTGSNFLVGRLLKKKY